VGVFLSECFLIHRCNYSLLREAIKLLNRVKAFENRLGFLAFALMSIFRVFKIK